MAKWVLDAAYGGKENGFIGQEGRREKNIALDAVLEAKKILELNGEQVFLIRSNDVFVNIKDRVEYANRWKADYYIVFEMNSDDDDENKRGTEVYINKEEKVLKKLAYIILEDMVEVFGGKNLGVKINKNLDLNLKEIPLIVCKGEFLSNKYIERNFNSKSYGKVIARACIKFLGKSLKNELKLTVTKDEKKGISSGWRVCVGLYKEFDEAKKEIEDLKARGISGTYIIPYSKNQSGK